MVLRSHNQTLIFILNKKSSKSKRVMSILRPLVLSGMHHNIHFKASHEVGSSNSIADSVSRQNWSLFRQLAPWEEESPVPVPESFLTFISSVKLTDC